MRVVTVLLNLCEVKTCIMAPINKRQHKTLTLAEKCKILDAIESGKSIRQVGEQFEVSKSTIFDIKAKKNKIRKYVSQTIKGPGTNTLQTEI